MFFSFSSKMYFLISSIVYSFLDIFILCKQRCISVPFSAFVIFSSLLTCKKFGFGISTIVCSCLFDFICFISDTDVLFGIVVAISFLYSSVKFFLVSFSTFVLIASNCLSVNTFLSSFKFFKLLANFSLINEEPLYNFNVFCSIKSVFFCNVSTLLTKLSILSNIFKSLDSIILGVITL